MQKQGRCFSSYWQIAIADPANDMRDTVLDHSPRLRRQADRFCLSTTATKWQGWDRPYLMHCSAGHEFLLTARQLSERAKGCPTCKSLGHLQRLKQRAERDGIRCLDTEWAGEAALYRFECPKGHQWYHSAQSPTKCMTCSQREGGLKRRDANGLQRLQEAADERGGLCLSLAYTTAAARYQFRCSAGHVWETQGRQIFAGAWCRSCAINALRIENRRSAQDMARLHEAAMAKGGLCLDSVYLGVNEKYRFRCEQGHEWRTLGALVLHGHWCRRCAVSTRLAEKRRVGALQQIAAKAAERGGLCLSTEYKGLNHRVRLRCVKGHEWDARAESALRGKWCRFCQADVKRLSIEDARAVAAARGGQCLSQTYVNLQSKLTWLCHRGHVWQARLGNVRSLGTWCPQCAAMAQITNSASKAWAKYRDAGPPSEGFDMAAAPPVRAQPQARAHGSR